MARKPREIVIGAAYHITARINRKEMIFVDDSFKGLFMDVVKKAKDKYSFKLSNFCIMGNHVHLTIEPAPDESLSRIMQWILSLFAQKYNRYHNLTGHVWYDRFKSKVIRTITQLCRTFKYIANNPVRAMIVNHPLKYAYNGISYYRQGKYKGILDPPDKLIQVIMRELLTNYDPELAQKQSKELGFWPKQPGRRKT